MLKGIIKDYGLLQTSGDLGSFYNKGLVIRTYMDNLFAIGTKEKLDHAKREIQ